MSLYFIRSSIIFSYKEAPAPASMVPSIRSWDEILPSRCGCCRGFIRFSEAAYLMFFWTQNQAVYVVVLETQLWFGDVFTFLFKILHTTLYQLVCWRWSSASYLVNHTELVTVHVLFKMSRNMFIPIYNWYLFFPHLISIEDDLT